ncbi:MAG: hypothetical protein IJT41_04855 [Clostridia bacterium]|nr:hypothetical protein [Clostridia bacterium]
MKKILITLLALCAVLCLLASCSGAAKMVRCSFCGKETSDYHSKTLDGEKIYVCDDCYAQLSGN